MSRELPISASLCINDVVYKAGHSTQRRYARYIFRIVLPCHVFTVRANAYHNNAHSGVVRLVHYGNRSVSLELFGGPSTLVIQADGSGEENKSKVKEALCYLSPEQTGSTETTSDDHRTDLYSLGIMFWTLLVGRGMLPFEGGPLEILHSIAQKRPMPVHEVRRDVPQVLAQIIEKAC